MSLQLSEEQLSQAFQILWAQSYPEELPEPLDQLDSEDWAMLELLLDQILASKERSSVH